MIYVLAGLVAILAAANTLTIRWAFASIENAALLGANERQVLVDLHARQLSEFANRIQEPKRAANLSIAEQAPEPEPRISPDFEYEREAISGE